MDVLYIVYVICIFKKHDYCILMLSFVVDTRIKACAVHHGVVANDAVLSRRPRQRTQNDVCSSYTPSQCWLSSLLLSLLPLFSLLGFFFSLEKLCSPLDLLCIFLIIRTAQSPVLTPRYTWTCYSSIISSSSFPQTEIQLSSDSPWGLSILLLST